MQTLAERNATPATTQPPKLMDRVVESLRVHRYALSTERTYCRWRSDPHPLQKPAEDEALVFLAALGQFDVEGAL